MRQAKIFIGPSKLAPVSSFDPNRWISDKNGRTFAKKFHNFPTYPGLSRFRFYLVEPNRPFTNANLRKQLYQKKDSTYDQRRRSAQTRTAGVMRKERNAGDERSIIVWNIVCGMIV